jgi:hypothetical protein
MPDKAGTMRLLMNTDWERFSGKAKETKIRMKVMPGAGVPMTLAPFSGVLYDLK